MAGGASLSPNFNPERSASGPFFNEIRHKLTLSPCPQADSKALFEKKKAALSRKKRS
jgi:hypothetical protein